MLLWLALAWGPSVLAFPNPLESNPPPGSILRVAPTAITIRFSEGLDPQTSIFKVYRLEVAPQDYDRLEVIEALAREVAYRILDHDENHSLRFDTGLERTLKSSLIRIRLRALVPGAYMVMWRALNARKEGTEGLMVFVYSPTAPAGSSR